MKCYEYAKQHCSAGKDKMDYSSKGEKVRMEKLIHFVNEEGQYNKILDVGCGDGTLGSMLLKNSNEIFGIEANEGAAEIAKKRGLRVKVQDIESGFSFNNNTFDVVVAAEIIEHILDTDFFIDEVRRVLKPNGFLVLSTPNIASLGKRVYLLLGKNPYFEASFGYPPEAQAGHIRFFTKDLLMNFLKYRGFTIVKFTSDIINFNSSGTLSSKLMADLFPTLGCRLIVKSQKKQ